MAHPGGRPADYRPEMCEEVIPMLKEGMSIEEIGVELDCGYSTVYQWMDRYPEFKEAIKKGREYSAGWWIKQGRVSLREKQFNTATWFINMKNRFGWSDKTENTVNVTDSSTKSTLEARHQYAREY